MKTPTEPATNHRHQRARDQVRDSIEYLRHCLNLAELAARHEPRAAAGLIAGGIRDFERAGDMRRLERCARG